MKYFLLFFLLCAAPQLFAQQYQSRPPIVMSRSGPPGYGSGVLPEGYDNSYTIGYWSPPPANPGLERIITISGPGPYAYVYGYSTSQFAPHNFQPAGWVILTPADETSPKGTFDPEGVPIDDQGQPWDLGTGQPIPTDHGAAVPITNPFSDRPMTFGVGQVGAGGSEIGYSEYTIPPGGTITVGLGASQPFDYFVYPIVEGQRGDPISSGSSTSTGSGGTGPPTQSAGPIITPPLDDLPDAPNDDIQAEIRRLADITKQSQDALRAGQNLTNTELNQLNHQTAQMKSLMAQVAANTAQANQHLSQIAANGGGSGSGSGGLTQEQLEESLGNGADEGPEPGEVGDAENKADGILGQIADIRAAMGTVSTSVGNMIDAAGLTQTYTQTSWNVSLPMGPFGTHVVDFSAWTWVFDLIRSVTLALISIHFLGVYIRTLRGALV